MKNNYIFLLIISLLTACSLLPMDKYDTWYSPTNFINIYFDNVYISNIHARFAEQNTVSICHGKCLEYGESDQVNFYQDKNRKCLLFSISNNDLINMEREFVKSNKNQQSVFIIEENGIRIISQAEYEQMKPTLAPHKFDSSLCK